MGTERTRGAHTRWCEHGAGASQGVLGATGGREELGGPSQGAWGNHYWINKKLTGPRSSKLLEEVMGSPGGM